MTDVCNKYGHSFVGITMFLLKYGLLHVLTLSVHLQASLIVRI